MTKPTSEYLLPDSEEAAKYVWQGLFRIDAGGLTQTVRGVICETKQRAPKARSREELSTPPGKILSAQEENKARVG